MGRLVGILFFVLISWSWNANATYQLRGLVQCEECSTINQMKGKALEGVARKGGGRGVIGVFSLKHGIVQAFSVEFLPQVGILSVQPAPPIDSLEEAFAHMLNANQMRPGILIAQQVIKGKIDDISSGRHDPVAVSINGEHDSAYGSFIFDVKSCFSSSHCASRISPELGELVGAKRKLNGLGVSLFGSGGDISWENLPPNIEIWLCNENNDCALIQYEDGAWVFVETRSEGGKGKRYPKYKENIEYTFMNSGEAGVFRRGLADAGVKILGDWSLATVLACTTAGGVETCQYFIVPQ